MNPKNKILIVDDEPVNVRVLQRKLEKNDYEVLMAHNGFECLEKVEQDPPDIILLDIMMPDLDGVETCRRLKENPGTRKIPVIFITAKTDRADKISGLRTGAIDYITKPIDMDETLARIQTHLRLQAMHSENIELQQRLADARRNAAIGNMTQGIAHNLNNLLGVVVGYLDLLKLRMNQPDKLESGIASMEKAVKRMVDLVRQLSSMVNDAPSGRIVADPVECAQNVIKRFTRGSTPDAQTVYIENQLPEGFRIATSIETVETCLGHLVRNGIESYAEGTPAGERHVAINLALLESEKGESLQLSVIDKGEGIHPSVRESLFDPFVSTRNSVGRGFGLTVVKHSVSHLGGTVSIGPNTDGTGTRAIITLPVSKE